MTTTSKERLVARIRALLSKTVENGATEAEAMSALAKAQEIMQSHGLDHAAVEAEAFVREKFVENQVRRCYWGRDLGYAIGQFTGTFPYAPVGEKAVTYCGRESDAIFAFWLTDALDAFVTRHARAYVMETGGARTDGSRRCVIAGQGDMFGGTALRTINPETVFARNKRIQDFGRGVCTRIHFRLLELATDETKQRAADAKRQLQREGMVFNKGRTGNKRATDAAAFNAGVKAGDHAQFNKPVNAGASVRMISM